MYGTSLWLDESENDAPSYPPLEERTEADVAIVGAGFTGLAVACNLRERFPERSVVVLEQARVGSGASGRSSGALTVVPERRFAEKVARNGVEETRRAAAFQRAGVDEVLRLVRAGGIACDLGTPGYLIAGADRHVDTLRREVDAMRAVGVDGRFLDRDALRAVISQDFYAAAAAGPAHWVHPGRYVRGLARVAQHRGARIHERSRVLKVEPHLLRLERTEVRAGSVVLATDGYSERLGLFRGRLFPVQTCAVATEPLSPEQWSSVGWEGRQVLREASRSGHTMVRSPSGRLCCRGTLHYGLDAVDLAAVGERLLAAIGDRFPQLGTLRASHTWSGLLGMTRTFRPAIGRLEDGILYAVGYSGHGIAYSALAGRLIAEIYGGEGSPELEYASRHAVPPRVPPGSLIRLGLRAAERRG